MLFPGALDRGFEVGGEMPDVGIDQA